MEVGPTCPGRLTVRQVSRFGGLTMWHRACELLSQLGSNAAVEGNLGLYINNLACGKGL